MKNNFTHRPRDCFFTRKMAYSENGYLIVNFNIIVFYVFSAFVSWDKIDSIALMIVKYLWILISIIYIVNKLSEYGINSLVSYIEYCHHTMFKDLSLAGKLSLVGFIVWLAAVIFKESAIILLTFIPISLFFFVWSSLIYLEGYSIVYKLKGYKSSSLMLLLLGTMFFYFSNVFTTKEIEYVTGVNADYFEYTRALGVFFCGFLLFSFTVFIVAAFFVLIDAIKKILWGSKVLLNIDDSMYVNQGFVSKKVSYFVLTILPIFIMGINSAPFLFNKENRSAQISSFIEYLDMVHEPICNNKSIEDNDKKYPVTYLGTNADVILYKKENKYYIDRCNIK